MEKRQLAVNCYIETKKHRIKSSIVMYCSDISEDRILFTLSEYQ